jgi:hypothetical protein
MPERETPVASGCATGDYIPLDVAWNQWKSEQIRAIAVCNECFWVRRYDAPCPKGFTSVKEHPECIASVFRAIRNQTA